MRGTCRSRAGEGGCRGRPRLRHGGRAGGVGGGRGGCGGSGGFDGKGGALGGWLIAGTQ